ncbi:MAG: GldG family protein [Opitutales bacterium]|nr:GldG family protein [Opitutales bacterium]NRA26099.1 GldG family protein [Opitutales bacterium]
MKSTQTLSAVLLLVAALILINIVGNLLPGQIDMTSGKLYSLSPGTNALLNELEEPIELTFYYSSSADGVPVSFKNFAERAEDLLEQYDRAGGYLVRLISIDPRPDTADEENAIRAGLTRQPLPNGAPLFLGLHVVQAEKETLIPFFQPEREPFMEYDISRLIYETTLLTRPRLGIITALDMDGATMPSMIPGQPTQGVPPWLVVDELRRTYDVSFLDHRDEASLESIDILAVIHPPKMEPYMLFAIDQFVLSGKPVLFAIDPSSTVRRMQSAQQSGGMFGGPPSQVSSSDLDNLLSGYGISFDPQKVVGDLDNALQVFSQNSSAPLLNPTYVALESFDSENPVMAQLNSIWLIEPGSLSVSPRPNVQFERLLHTSKRSGEMINGSLSFLPPDQLMDQILPDSIERTLAGVMTGKFQTAFPDGSPPKPEEEKDEGEQLIEALQNSLLEGGGETNSFLSESAETSRIVVLSDTDFIFDEFAVQRVNLFGAESYRPYNDNLAFFANLIDSLAGSEALLNIRGKGSIFRTFDRIEAMERAAQESFRNAQIEVEAQIAETSRQLRELQQQQDSQGILVASPEVLDAIEDLRNNEADFRQRLREIRKTMREDIEATEITLAAFNMIVSPVIIILFGIAFFVQRGKRK